MATNNSVSGNASAAITNNGDFGGINDGELEVTHQERSRCCFQEWMQLQREDLTQLARSLETHDEDQIKTLIESCIVHFEDYMATRSRLAQEDASAFFAPTWCTSLENSLLWVAGCRPSIFIRLLYAVSGHEMDARLGEWLRGIRRMGAANASVGDLSPSQLVSVDTLHMRTIREEERLTGEMASCQEELGDQPIAVIAYRMNVEAQIEANGEVQAALSEHESVMRGVMRAADELRLTTLKGLLEILNPVQAVEYLVASKKLHLSLHHCGRRKDERHGRRFH